MSNKTFIPAFQCKVGDWKYYICMMKYGEVARQVNFAHELRDNNELSALIQRGISERTKGITDYLLTSEHRFLGGLVIAAWGGEPQYTRLAMDDPDGILHGLDREFGVLTFDGTQQYFALDGQHRLKAIKDAIRQKPTLGQDDICVLIVTHYDDPKGRTRTRRLFSNINRNAKPMGQGENIALDEDDGYAILARRLIDEHELLRQQGRVKVIVSSGDNGELNLAKSNVPKGDPKALTTLTVLYDVLRYLGVDQPSAMKNRTLRPSDEILEDVYKVLSGRLNDLLTHCGNIRQRLESADSARDLRSPKGQEGTGHPFMRPVVQKAVAKVAGQVMAEGALPWTVIVQRLAQLDWRMDRAPWEAVFSVEGGKMLSGKENTELLGQLLRVHIAPRSKADITRVCKSFKSLRSKKYAVAEEDLAKHIVEIDEGAAAKIELPVEISGDGEG
jgi:DNA sulfur modification protein DndB